MKSLLIVLIVAATVTLGVFNLRRFRRGAPDSMMITVHLLLGIGGLVTLLFSGAASDGGSLGVLAAGLLALAVFRAVLSAVVRGNGSRAANVLLATHAVCGVGGLLAAVGWALQ